MVKQIPKGLDQQGRYPEAAHAASEVDEYGLEMPERYSTLELVIWAIVVCVGVVCAVGMYS